MERTEAAMILAGVVPQEQQQASAPTNLHVITGTIVGNSSEGKTLLQLDGIVLSEDDNQYIEVDTLGGLEEGDVATVLLTGESGHGLTPLAVGAPGSIDRVNVNINNVSSTISTVADGINETMSGLSDSLEELSNRVVDLNQYIVDADADREKWVQTDEDGITIGAEGSDYKLHLDNNSVDFVVEDEMIATASADAFIPKALRLGNYVLSGVGDYLFIDYDPL